MVGVTRQLEFDPVRSAGLPAPAEGWAAWLKARERPIRHFCAYDGPAVCRKDARMRLGGVFVAPADEVLGIRLWNDACEGVLEPEGVERTTGTTESIPWVAYDLEKILRMMLHQSGLALEILASPVVLRQSEMDLRGIVEAAMTRGIVDHYLDVARGIVERASAVRDEREGQTEVWRDAIHQALVGLALCEGRVSFSLSTLLEWRDEEGLAAALEGGEAGGSGDCDDLRARATGLIDELEASERAGLPESPRGYDALNDYLVQTRLKVREEAR